MSSWRMMNIEPNWRDNQSHVRSLAGPLTSRGSSKANSAVRPPIVTGFCAAVSTLSTAFDWLFARGGAALQSDYPYRGVNGLCDDAAPDGAAFSGKYVWVGGGSDGLKAALMAKGPMTVSVDASAQDFTL